MTDLANRFFVLLQHVLPKYFLTSAVRRLARVRSPSIKDFLIRRFVAFYDVNVEELVHPVPEGYPTFNDFFIRELAPGTRPVDLSASGIASPVDGTVSAAGKIEKSSIFQAKGINYSLTDLLATDMDEAERYVDGAFATIYLAPYNYHRIHAPADCRLRAARYVPGALYSVNEATVHNLPQLFTQNERLVCHLETDAGPMVMIFVGAMNVGTITTRWTGDLKPVRNGVVETIDLSHQEAGLAVSKGETVGWFNMGSTVILLLPPGSSDEFGALEPGLEVRMGQPIGQFTH